MSAVFVFVYFVFEFIFPFLTTGDSGVLERCNRWTVDLQPHQERGRGRNIGHPRGSDRLLAVQERRGSHRGDDHRSRLLVRLLL